jgi:hypothetical protein
MDDIQFNAIKSRNSQYILRQAVFTATVREMNSRAFQLARDRFT